MASQVRYVFHDLHIENDVALEALIGELLRACASIVDGERTRFRVSAGHDNIALRWIDSDDRKSKPCHGLTKQATPTTDIQQG